MCENKKEITDEIRYRLEERGIALPEETINELTEQALDSFLNRKRLFLEDAIELIMAKHADQEKIVIKNEYKAKQEERNKKLIKLHPEINPDVLTFITDLTYCYARTEDQCETMRNTFCAGYCWHFAHLLKTAFGRGEVCWAAPFSHFVWVDENGVPYDADGVNFGEQTYHIPESYLGEFINGFIHIPNKETPEPSEKDVLEIIRGYENDNGLPHVEIKL